MTNRVVITGMGIVGPVGNDRETFLKNIFDSKVGIEKITKFDATQTGISVAGEVKDFDPKNSIGKKAAKRMDLFSQYAVHSAIEAVEQAIQGTDCNFSQFVIEATRVALDNLKEEES